MSDKNKIIDLHVHTDFSDGTDSPATAVKKAANRGLAAIAITDHDTIEGIQEGLEQGLRSGVEVIAGVELSAVIRQKSIHVLGYGLQTDNPFLLKRLEGIQSARKKRNRDIIENLKRMGIEISLKELHDLSQEGQAGRPHLASLLHKKKVVRNTEEAFSRYLGKEGSAYAPREALSAEEAIEIIHKAGGVAVLAHPLTVDTGSGDLSDILKELKSSGLDGLEVLYPNYNQDIRDYLIKISRKYDLLITGGSDFHGKNKPNIRMGRISGNQNIPYSILKDLKDLIKKKLPN